MFFQLINIQNIVLTTTGEWFPLIQKPTFELRHILKVKIVAAFNDIAKGMQCKYSFIYHQFMAVGQAGTYGATAASRVVSVYRIVTGPVITLHHHMGVTTALMIPVNTGCVTQKAAWVKFNLFS